MMYDVKYHKARLVAGGHLTKTLGDSINFGVVSLKGIKIILFLAKSNGVNSLAVDMGNASLEALTKEKVYILVGPEFGNLEGQILVINKAIYGLRSSGVRWHEKLADTLRDEITGILVERYKYKLKGTDPVTYPLDCKYFIHRDGILCYPPKKYIEKLVIDFESIFGSKPKLYSSPLEKDDHPELDTCYELAEEDVKKY